MSGVLATLKDMWFVHKVDMAPYLDGGEDRYHQPTTTYGTPVEIPLCKFQDLSEMEINSLTQAGVVNVSKKLLAPPEVDPAFKTKISNVRTNGRDVNGIADLVIDANSYEVARTIMKRSTVDEYRQIFLRRIQ